MLFKYCDDIRAMRTVEVEQWIVFLNTNKNAEKRYDLLISKEDIIVIEYPNDDTVPVLEDGVIKYNCIVTMTPISIRTIEYIFNSMQDTNSYIFKEQLEFLDKFTVIAMYALYDKLGKTSFTKNQEKIFLELIDKYVGTEPITEDEE